VLVMPDLGHPSFKSPGKQGTSPDHIPHCPGIIHMAIDIVAGRKITIAVLSVQEACLPSYTRMCIGKLVYSSTPRVLSYQLSPWALPVTLVTTRLYLQFSQSSLGQTIHGRRVNRYPKGAFIGKAGIDGHEDHDVGSTSGKCLEVCRHWCFDSARVFPVILAEGGSGKGKTSCAVIFVEINTEIRSGIVNFHI
jgi:hypothetical protein